MSNRILCWFSCGAASAVATKMTILGNPNADVVPICCDTRPSENYDNYRFSGECEKWFGKPITFISSDKYKTVDDVFDKSSYMSGIRGAKCTTELKKIPRLAFAQPDDVHVFGFTADERKRVKQFEDRNPDMILLWTLVDQGITKRDCYDMVREAGIRLPVMYEQGFDNNSHIQGHMKGFQVFLFEMAHAVVHLRKFVCDEIFRPACIQSFDFVRIVCKTHRDK